MKRTLVMPPDDESIRFERTPRNKGDQTTITITRYDTGMWALNGRPQTSVAAVVWVLAGAVMKLEEESRP
jgi:hypothetical protein